MQDKYTIAGSSSALIAEGYQQIKRQYVIMHKTNKITKLHSNNCFKTEAGFGVLFLGKNSQIKWIIF